MLVDIHCVHLGLLFVWFTCKSTRSRHRHSKQQAVGHPQLLLLLLLLCLFRLPCRDCGTKVLLLCVGFSKTTPAAPSPANAQSSLLWLRGGDGPDPTCYNKIQPKCSRYCGDGRPAVAILMFNVPRATNESHAEDVVAHGSSSGSIEHETLPPLQNGDTRAPLFRGQKRDGQGWLHEREFVVLLLGLLYIPLSPSPTETL